MTVGNHSRLSFFINCSGSSKRLNTLANRMYATLSIFFSWSATISPILREVTSFEPELMSFEVTILVMESICSNVTCVLPTAFIIPLLSFAASNCSLLRSRLITKRGTSSIRSYVVKRFSHLLHTRRRRTVIPSSLIRVSITSESGCLQ